MTHDEYPVFFLKVAFSSLNIITYMTRWQGEEDRSLWIHLSAQQSLIDGLFLDILPYQA